MFYNSIMEKKLKYDVVIIGGGTSGCACAYNCAKNDLKTLLVEKNNFLGGLMTGGLVVPVMKSSVDDINCDYYKKLVNCAKKYNAQITYKDKNDGWFNPELLKIVLDEILTSPDVNNNLDILFETDIMEVIKKDSSIKSVILSCGLLSIPVEATYFVDATGCAKLSKLSGCEFLSDTDMIQKNTLRFILGNVDVNRFCEFIKNVDNNEDITNTYRDERNTNNELHFTTASTADTSKFWALDKYLKLGVDDKILLEEDREYFQIFSIAGAKGEVAFNCPRINNYKNNPYKASRELIYARRAILRLLNFTKKYFPGFEDAIIVNIATQTGIREEGRVKTKYIYKKEDMLNNKTFKTPVLKANYEIDIHNNDKRKTTIDKMPSYSLPIESLMSYDINNLFVIGKILGADFEAHSALRVQKSCMSTGEGVAKYIKSIMKN